MTWTNKAAAIGCATFALAALSACSREMTKCDAVAETAAAEPAKPQAVRGWREYPLKEGVIKIQPAKWTSETIDILAPGNGGELEYKLGMKKGDGIVYSISYGSLEHPGMMVTEFHGHTEKDTSGVGDLMFYSKAGGSTENGSFQAPWDGIHGWYLKNDSTKDVVVKLEVAGFYERLDKKPQ
jgi:hypothetical protein